MALDTHTLQLVPGPGIVQRQGPTIVAAPLADACEDFVERLLANCRALAGPDLIKELARSVLDARASSAPPFGVVAAHEDRLLVFLHGAIELRTDRLTLSGADAVTWVERTLDTDVETLVVTSAGQAAEADARTNLATGVVGAAGFKLTTATDEPGFEVLPMELPTESADREPLAVDSEPAGDDTDSEESPGEVPEALVEGVLCPRDHHNDPESPYCAQCGLKMGVHRTLHTVTGPRPALGVLVFDDGTTVAICRDLVIGREPHGDELVVAGKAKGVALKDDSATVSRAHAHIALDGWSVHVTDRNSANGTQVRYPGEEAWHDVRGSERVRLTPGMTVRLGDRLLSFEPHGIANGAS